MEKAVSIVESDIQLPPSATGAVVYDTFLKNPDLLCIAIVEDALPVGIINRSSFFLRFGDRFGRALYEKRPIEIIMDAAPVIIDADQPLPALHLVDDNAGTSALLSGFIVTKGGRYAGVSSALSLYRAMQMRADQLEAILAEAEEARRAAAEADAAKSRFLATMSHELRTPLNAIIGYAEIISEEYGDANDGLLSDAGRISSAANHLLALINDVIDFAKVETHQTSVDPVEFDIPAWADDTLSMIAPLAHANGNVLDVDIAAKLPLAYSDPARLRQCLINLAGNACKFTRNGTVRVAIAAVANELTIRIEDTGIGMTPEQLNRIFQPFVQADASISRRFGGSGLGLSITRQLARLLGGEITAESQAGCGSRFKLAVPLRIAQPGHIERAA